MHMHVVQMGLTEEGGEQEPLDLNPLLSKSLDCEDGHILVP